MPAKESSGCSVSRKKLVANKGNENIKMIHPHEKVLMERSSGMLNYISSLRPWTVLPSILVCSETKVIIDGHHRYYVLKKLGYESVPVSYIRYESDEIITHDIEQKKLEKSFIIKSGLTGDLLEPKSSMHHCLYGSYVYPVILLSDLRVINHEA